MPIRSHKLTPRWHYLDAPLDAHPSRPPLTDPLDFMVTKSKIEKSRKTVESRADTKPAILEFYTATCGGAAALMRQSFATSFVESYVNAWNRRDPNGVVEHLHEDGHYIDAPTQQQLTYTTLETELIEYFQGPVYHYEVLGEVLHNGETIAFQYQATPTESPDSSITWQGAEFITLQGTTAQEISDYYQALTPNDVIKSTHAVRRYAKSGLHNEALKVMLRRLKQLMSEDKLYLDPDLSLPKLAEHLGTSVNHLSQAINSGLEMTFFDYINHYRITEAMEILRKGSERFPPILDVALSVGFNSTSTFYTAFKKINGHSPAKFRRAHSQSAKS